MADSASNGLFGVDPDLLLNVGMGLLSAGGKHLAGQGNTGEALMGAMQNYYGQKQAKQSLAMGNLDLQTKQLQNMKVKSLLDTVGGLMGPPDDGQGNAPPSGLMAPMPQTPSQSPPVSGSPFQPAPLPGAPPQGPAPNGQGPMAPPQQMPPPQQLPPWMASPPTQQSLSQQPIQGMNPRGMLAMNMLNGKDPLQSAKEIEAAQMEQARRQYAPVLAKLDTFIKSDNPTRELAADPELSAAWQTLAKQHGYDPKADLSDANVRTAFTYARNGLASNIGQEAVSPVNRTVQGVAPDGRTTQTDPLTGKVTYDAAGPNIITAEDKIRNNLDAQKFAMEQKKQALETARIGLPAGYEADPDKPGGVRPIAGGPADPLGPGGGMGNRAEVTFNRVTSAGNSAVESLKNISELPMGASTGWLGVGGSGGHGILSTIKGNLVTKLQPQEVQDYNVMVSGLGRNLATLETQGLAPPGGFTKSMDRLEVQAGDSQMTVLRKQAEARQIIETNLQASLANPKIPAPQKQFITDILNKVKVSIPYTNHDITMLERSKNPSATIMDFAGKSGVIPMKQPDMAAAAAAELARRQQQGQGQ